MSIFAVACGERGENLRIDVCIDEARGAVGHDERRAGRSFPRPAEGFGGLADSQPRIAPMSRRSPGFRFMDRLAAQECVRRAVGEFRRAARGMAAENEYVR